MEIKHNFKERKVWQKSRLLVRRVFELTRDFPGEKKYTLVGQIRRVVISLPSYIAEGSGRNSSKGLNRIPGISLSSSNELETQLIVSADLGCISLKELNSLSEIPEEIQKMIFGFRRTLDEKTI